MTDDDTRSPGRPRRGDEPDLDHRELERLLIHGEWTEGPDGVERHRYPTYRELAERFGVKKTTVFRFSRLHNCLERRAGSGVEGVPHPAGEVAEDEAAEAAKDVEELLAETDTVEGDDQRMLPTVREIFVTWVRAVQDGEIRITSAGEIEKMMRIAADLDAEAQMRALIPEGVPTLEDLQDLYEERQRGFEASTPAMRGRVPIGLDEPEPPERAPSGADAAPSSEESDRDPC